MESLGIQLPFAVSVPHNPYHNYLQWWVVSLPVEHGMHKHLLLINNAMVMYYRQLLK